MSGYIGSKSDKATFHGSQAYRGKDVNDCVQIKKSWYWLEEIKDPEAIELLGRYSVHIFGWGNQYVDWDSFTTEEKELLKTTLK